VRQHGATASRALEDGELVQAVLADYRSAPISEELRATLWLLEQVVTDPGTVVHEDVERVRAAGVSDGAIEDALHIGALFVIFNKLADALGWSQLSAEVYDKRAAIALERGYVVPDELVEP
jgi:alkylhydroperoxidase family enzyme